MRDLHLTAGVVDLTLGRVERNDRGDDAETLTTTERALLGYLAAHPGRDVPRTELLTQVWGYSPSASSRALDTAVKVLRRKVERDPRKPDHILTVWGVGYRFEPLHAEADADARADADLIGRDGELAALHAALRGGARLLTLVGPGGVGKTRLARAIADGLSDALFVDLSTAATDEHLVQAVALAWPDPERRPLSDRLSELPRVLILDNVEQVLASVRAVALPWLDAAPDLTLVLTSRTACGDDREQAVDVRPLPLAAATALLRRRTAQARRAEVVENDAVLQQVAAAMDGLPLALELAASRAAVLGMDEILRRGPRLVSDDTDGPDRHGSILAAVRWSLDLVDAEARQVLSACASFRAPFRAADVEVVAGADVVAPLGRLFQASLVSRHPDGAHLHLLPLVRLAVEAIAPAPPPMVARYVAHVLARAASGRDGARAVADDLRGLVDRADLAPEWVARAGILLVGVLERASGGRRDADVDRIRDAADRSGDPALRAEAQLLRCSAELWAGRARRDTFDEAIALSRAARDRGRVGWALGHLGTWHRLGGDAPSAVRTLTEAVAIAGDDGPPDRLATLLTELGLARRAAFDWTGALEAFDAALPHAARAGDAHAEQALMHRLGGTLLQLARFDAAQVWLARARDTAERASLVSPAFEIRGSLAYLELERGDLDAAEAGYAWCLGQAALGRGFHRVVMHAQLALLCVERGAFARAAELAAVARSWAARGAGAPPEALAHLADGVWRAFVGDPGAGPALTAAIAVDPTGDQALFALGYRSVLGGSSEDAAELARRAADTASPAVRALVEAASGGATGSAWVHARLVRALRRRTG